MSNLQYFFELVKEKKNELSSKSEGTLTIL